MPIRKVKRIVSDQQKHEESMPLEEKESEGVLGSEPATGSDEAEKDVLDTAHDVGLYEESDEEKPHEANIAEEVDEAERRHQKED